MPYNVLNENWSDYDNKKIRDQRDAKNFACTEVWEVEYLVKKIRRAYPAFDESRIRSAIRVCCSELKSPYPRKQFVECVMRRLKEM